MSDLTATIPTKTLLLQGIPVTILDKLKALAEAQNPRLTRNALIEWILIEYAEGRLSILEEGKEGAA